METWMDRPEMEKLDPVKRELLMRAYRQTAGKSGKELAPVMMALIIGAGKQGIRFSPEEISLILELLKDGKTPEEQARIDQTMKMAASFLKK